MSPFVRTVLGDVPAAELGVCYAHEHLIIDPSFTTYVTPEFELSDLERATRELRTFRADGGRALVDSMPCDSGRNVVKLAALARAADVHIIAPTGLHLPSYYPPGHWSSRYSVEQLAALFIDDIEQGIDAHDYDGPLVARTPHRAGVIKIATGLEFTPREERIFAAAALAHRRTGAPLLTHTEKGLLALEQVERLRHLGVDLRHVVLSHLDRRPDLAYHRAILATGVRVEYDSAFRWPPGQGNPTLDLLRALLPEFSDQIMLGMDAARSTYWTEHGGRPGMSYLLREFRPALHTAGVSEEQLHRVFVSTPADAYAFSPSPSPSLQPRPVL
jgi:predicted metal-dependent phosphotriesterase family hydrolase